MFLIRYLIRKFIQYEIIPNSFGYVICPLFSKAHINSQIILKPVNCAVNWVDIKKGVNAFFSQQTEWLYFPFLCYK